MRFVDDTLALSRLPLIELPPIQHVIKAIDKLTAESVELSCLVCGYVLPGLAPGPCSHGFDAAERSVATSPCGEH